MRKLILFLVLLIATESSFPLVYSSQTEQTSSTERKTNNTVTQTQEGQNVSTNDLALLYKELGNINNSIESVKSIIKLNWSWGLAVLTVLCTVTTIHFSFDFIN